MRSRNVKPGFLKNETLCEIEPLGRLLFTGLWMLADREGRLEDRPKRIKADTLPYDECDCDELLWQLHNKGFIVRFRVGELRYISIPTFLEHQKPHQNETHSKIPEVSAGCIVSHLGSKGLVPLADQGNEDSGLLSESLLSESLNPSTSVLSHGQPRLVGKREKSQAEKLAAEYAPIIHKRHIARKCSLKQTEELLVRILNKHPRDQQFAVMERINRNHEAHCLSEDWTKEGGQFCPGLDKWLNVKQERYFIELPEARASPVSGVILTAQEQRAQRVRKEIEESGGY